MKFDIELKEELKKTWNTFPVCKYLEEVYGIPTLTAGVAISCWVNGSDIYVLDDALNIFKKYEFLKQNVTFGNIVQFMLNPKFNRVRECLPKRDGVAISIILYHNIYKIYNYYNIIDNMESIKDSVSKLSLEDFSKRLQLIFNKFKEFTGRLGSLNKLILSNKLITCSEKKLHIIFKEYKVAEVATFHGEAWERELEIRCIPDSIKELGFTQFTNIKNIYEWSEYAGNCIYKNHRYNIISDFSMLYLKNEKEGITLQLRIDDGTYSIIEIRGRFNVNVDPSHPIFKVLG